MIDYSGMYDHDEKDDEIVEEVEEIESTDKEDDLVFGRVSAEMLYLREGPSKGSKDLKVLKKDEELMIDEPFNAYDEWIHVCTQEGIEGYVMKAFVRI